ncbi:hypothetical protein CXB51_014509 [Gossypium anomalum]|uniref:MADS-box domain-containing protein n=1 Tax=Gossypium anomalum TaxID=47600 RepID=A0A8J5YRN9_9ROSI|nr:hypothetical protein CXB51_014509 [Gossypium anomalum]
MGRRKLKIQRLEDMKARQAKYSKQKRGTLKKAKYCAMLKLFFYSLHPQINQPFLLVKTPMAYITFFRKSLNMPFVECKERKAYTMEKFYVNWESKFDPLSLPCNKNVDTLELYEDQLQKLKDKLSKKSKILRDWKNPENVEDLNQIKFMEDYLIASLNGFRNRKNQLAMEEQSREGYLEVGLLISMKLFTYLSTTGKENLDI